MMYENLKKDDKICWEIYRLLFAAASPPADFDQLVENAIIDEKGQKHIPFMDYEIDDRVMNLIIDSVLREKKVKKDKWQMFKNTIHLGCSPKHRQKISNIDTIYKKYTFLIEALEETGKSFDIFIKTSDDKYVPIPIRLSSENNINNTNEECL